jgi:hypothetical protein
MPEPQPKERNQAAARDDERNSGNGAKCTDCTHDAPVRGGEPGRSRCDFGSEVRPTVRARRGRICTAREPPAEMTRDLLVRDHLTVQSAGAVEVRRTAWRAFWRAAGLLPIQRVAGERRLPSTCRYLPRKWMTAVVRQESNRFLHRRTVRARLRSYPARHVPVIQPASGSAHDFIPAGLLSAAHFVRC